VIHELADVPGLVHDRRFREGVRRLLAEGKTPGEIARAVRSAAEDPQERGGLSFIADRFPRWARKVKERERQECQCLQNESAKSERLERERQLVEERECIRAEQESAAGKHLVAEACARLPWRR
jgi:hypothetical protein